MMRDSDVVRRPGFQVLQPDGTMDFGVHPVPLSLSSYTELIDLTNVVHELQPTAIAYALVERSHVPRPPGSKPVGRNNVSLCV